MFSFFPGAVDTQMDDHAFEPAPSALRAEGIQSFFRIWENDLGPGSGGGFKNEYLCFCGPGFGARLQKGSKRIRFDHPPSPPLRICWFPIRGFPFVSKLNQKGESSQLHPGAVNPFMVTRDEDKWKTAGCKPST